jgi:hypothetical protein
VYRAKLVLMVVAGRLNPPTARIVVALARQFRALHGASYRQGQSSMALTSSTT